MGICIKKQSGISPISKKVFTTGRPGATKKKRRTDGFNPSTQVLPPVDTRPRPKPVGSGSWKPAFPDKWGLPAVIDNPEITNHSINFEQRKITWTLEFDPVHNTNPDTTKCPPILDDPVMLLGSEFPFDEPKRTSKTLSISCEDNPEAFAAFTHQGDDGINLLTYPKNYNGKYAEEFFYNFFITGIQPEVDLPDDYECVNSLPICYETPKTEKINRKPNRSGEFGNGGQAFFITSISISENVIQYNGRMNGMPTAIKGRRYDDNVIVDETAPAFNFDSLPPELEEGLEGLRVSVEQIKGVAIPESPKGAAQFPEDGDARDDETPLCGFQPDVDFSAVMNLLTFNYSFFSERIIDLLFIRLWSLMELILWLCWNIFPLCEQEWNTVLGMVKRIFSLDVRIGGGECFPVFLENSLNVSIKNVFAPSTCCSWTKLLIELAKSLANPINFANSLRLMQSCVFYWLVCLLRMLRNFIAIIVLTVANFILQLITYGANVICDLMRNIGSGIGSAGKVDAGGLADEVRQAQELQNDSDNVAGV